MKNRLNIYKKRHTTTIIWILIVFVLFCVAAFISFKTARNPEKLTLENAEEDAVKTVVITDISEITYNEKQNEFGCLVLLDDDTVAHIFDKKEDALKKIEEEVQKNPVKKIVSLVPIEKDEAFIEIKNELNKNNLTLHTYSITEASFFERWLISIGSTVAAFVSLFSIFSGRKSYKKVKTFFKENERYNYTPAELSIKKHIEFVDKYMFVTNASLSIVNLNNYTKVNVSKVKKMGFTQYISCVFKNEEDTLPINLPKLKPEELNTLITHLETKIEVEKNV